MRLEVDATGIGVDVWLGEYLRTTVAFATWHHRHAVDAVDVRLDAEDDGGSGAFFRCTLQAWMPGRAPVTTGATGATSPPMTRPAIPAAADSHAAAAGSVTPADRCAVSVAARIQALERQAQRLGEKLGVEYTDFLLEPPPEIPGELAAHRVAVRLLQRVAHRGRSWSRLLPRG